MPANIVMIKKLQSAINDKFGQKLLFNQTQWYSEEAKRPITVYRLSKPIESDSKKKGSVELFSSYSQINIVFWLRDYWYELNGWEIPCDEHWEKEKQNYYEKHTKEDI